MFDVGFSEICLVGLVSLLVIGPKKMPEVARFVGFWIGKIQRMVGSVQQEFKENIYAEEVRQIMQQQTEMMGKLEQESRGVQDLLAKDVQHLQTGLAKTFNDLKLEQPNQAINISVELPPHEPTAAMAVPPVKRPKNKYQRRHGKK